MGAGGSFGGPRQHVDLPDGQVGILARDSGTDWEHKSGTVISGATTLTPPTGATHLLIQALTQNVRYTLDGTAPTASLGFQLRAGDPPVIIPIGAGIVVKVIQELATASLQHQWLKDS